MGYFFVLFDVSMEIHHGKFTLGNGGHTLFPKVKSPFTAVKGRCVTATNISQEISDVSLIDSITISA